MDPLTLKVLATLVQVHGTSATVVSTNKGIDDLLDPIREQIQNDGPRFAADGDLFNCKLKHCKDLYTKEIKYYKYTGVTQSPAKKKPSPMKNPSSNTLKRK
jgi:hypothetical protein